MYSLENERVEYLVWFSVFAFIGLTFTILMILTLILMFASSEPASETHFYTIIILVLQFSALMAFVPFLVRMMGTGKGPAGGDSRWMKRQLTDSVCSLTQAKALLAQDYTLESEDRHDGLTRSTFFKNSYSSALIRIESREDRIVKVY